MKFCSECGEVVVDDPSQAIALNYTQIKGTWVCKNCWKEDRKRAKEGI